MAKGSLFYGLILLSFMVTPAQAQIANITKFSLELSQKPASSVSNWYSISGGAQIIQYDNNVADVGFSEVEVAGPFVSGGSRAEMLKLLNTWATQTGERFNATVSLMDSDQETVRSINFLDSIPTYYDPPSVRAGDDSLLEERFSFKPSRMEVASIDGENKISDSSVKAMTDFGSGITGRQFKFEIEGTNVELTSVDPGDFKLVIKDSTTGPRQTDSRTYEISKPKFGSWKIVRQITLDRSPLADLFSQAKSSKGQNLGFKISLIYLDRNGSEARRINCTGAKPTSYTSIPTMDIRAVDDSYIYKDIFQSISVDSRNSGQAATETMEFSVARCEYL